LLATTALAATPSLLKQAVLQADLSGLVEWRTFIISSPLKIVDFGVVVRHCRFEAATGYTGPLLDVAANAQCVIECCTFIGNGKNIPMVFT
jgi:hypothetical protein